MIIVNGFRFPTVPADSISNERPETPPKCSLVLQQQINMSMAFFYVVFLLTSQPTT